MLALIVLGAGCEGLSVGLVFPLAKLALDGGAATRSGLIHTVAEYFPELSPPSLLLLFAAGFVAVMVFKNIVLLISTVMQARLVWNAEIEAGRTLMASYLRQPYLFHLQRNSSVLIRNLNDVMPGIFAAIMMPALRLIAELFIVAAISVVLLAIDPVVTALMLAGATLVGASAFGALKAPLKRWGTQRVVLFAERLKCLQQTLGGIKEIRVLGREWHFLQQYTAILSSLSRLTARILIVGDFRRAATEMAAVAGLAVLIMLAAWQKRDAHDLLAFVGVFAAAALRLMPSVNRILMALESIRAGLPALDIAVADFPGFQADLRPATESLAGAKSPHSMITCENLNFCYPGAARPSLQDLNLTIRGGETVGIVGPSGSGKTTLVDLLLGLLPPSEGRILVDGEDIVAALRSWQRRIGYVPQTIHLNDDTLKRNVALGLDDSDIDDEKLARALALAQLTETVEKLPQRQDTVLGERGARLSGGQRQRIGIARAVYDDPEILIFDEATSALDSETERSVSDSIHQLHGHKTVIIIAHRLSTVQQCDRLIYLDGGRMVASGTFLSLYETHAGFRRLVELSQLTPDSQTLPTPERVKIAP